MKTTTLLKTLPVLGLTLVLSACGGGDDDPQQNGSITACFTANQTVNYAVATSNVPAGQVGVSRSRIRPTTYSGQAVTEQTFFYVRGNATYTELVYWAVTNNGVASVANIDMNNIATPYSVFFPQGMGKNQTVISSTNDRYTFVGFETFSLANKSFYNTCHFNIVDSQSSTEDNVWYAPGYGVIKEVHSNGVITQYNGDL
jgi:hypothetical protein